MALSKLAISLIAGIGSVAIVGGIAAGVVVSNNKSIASAVEEERTEDKEKNKPSVSENKNETEVQNDKQASSSTNNQSTDKNSEKTKLNKPTDLEGSTSETKTQKLKERKEREIQQKQIEVKDMDVTMNPDKKPAITSDPSKKQCFKEKGNTAQKGETEKTQMVQVNDEQKTTPEPVKRVK